MTKDYLNPKWQKKRLEILERDNFTCTECGETKKTLHVHHSHYKNSRKIWEYSNNSLITLCDECHETQHKDIKKLEPYKIRRLSYLLSLLHDYITDTKLQGEYERRVKLYEYYRDLFVSYIEFGEDIYMLHEFDENEGKFDDEVNNFTMLESLLYYKINTRNVRKYINGCIMMKGYAMKPSEIGKDLLDVSRHLERSVF